jgi:hypothetical protein
MEMYATLYPKNIRNYLHYRKMKVKVNISLLQAMEAPWVVRG